MPSGFGISESPVPAMNRSRGFSEASACRWLFEAPLVGGSGMHHGWREWP